MHSVDWYNPERSGWGLKSSQVVIIMRYSGILTDDHISISRNPMIDSIALLPIKLIINSPKGSTS